MAASKVVQFPLVDVRRINADIADIDGCIAKHTKIINHLLSEKAKQVARRSTSRRGVSA